MTAYPGLKVRLFASEPMVRQPVAIEFDDRGRLWVIQYLQYPNPAGLERVQVDRYSRTIYDRQPEPPPRGPRGADRITILEDRDGDGMADSSKDFVEGLNLASGLAFGCGGVFVLQAPYLLFYPDRDRDDVPDCDPEVLLSGFGMEDAHSVANSLTWGPDGWLYGLQGSTVTANIRGATFQQGVWRYHPRTRQFELFSEGGGNMWGLDFDRHGQLFASTNVGGFVMLHSMQGAYYWKSFGKHGALHNPYSFGYFDHVSHEGVRGGHVAVGGLFYEADAFPESLRGKYLAADLLDHSAHWHEVSPRGSTFQARQGGDLLRANDSWFAPSDITLGPDGSVYIADWTDKRTAHPDPDADWDRSNGRIFAIDGKSHTPAQGLDMAALSSEGLINLLNHPNVWYARKARRLLTERRDQGVIPGLREKVLKSHGGAACLEAFWALYGCGGFDAALAERLLEHTDADIRAWTVRLLADERKLTSDLGAHLIQLAAIDRSVVVRAQLASSAQRLPAAEGLAIAHKILLRDLDRDDPFLPLLLWWAIERHSVADRNRTLDLFASRAAWDSTMVREVILGRLMRRYAAEASEPGDSACARLLASAPNPAGRQTLLGALDEGLRGREAGCCSPSLHQAIASLGHDDPEQVTVIRVAARLGDRASLEHALTLSADDSTPENTRLVLLDVLGQVRDRSCLEPLLKLATGNSSEPVQVAALDALSRFTDNSISTAVLSAYPGKDSRWRARARALLLSRASWARGYLEAIEHGKYSADEVTLDQVSQVALFHEPALDALVRKHWGMVKGPTPEERLAEVRRLNNDLRAAAGDSVQGKKLFMERCATCHRFFGEGNQVGPDLTHANRVDRDYLLVSLVDPSGVIRKEYQSYVVALRDGRVLTGLIADQSQSTLTLVDAKNERTMVARGEIEAITESASSLMPENLYKEFSPPQLRDLFSFLESDGPAERGNH